MNASKAIDIDDFLESCRWCAAEGLDESTSSACVHIKGFGEHMISASQIMLDDPLFDESFESLVKASISFVINDGGNLLYDLDELQAIYDDLLARSWVTRVNDKEVYAGAIGE